MPDVNIWAVLLATLSTIVVGSIWYTPAVFGNRWMDLARIDRERMEQSAVGPIVVTVVVSLVTAYVLTVATEIVHDANGGNFLFNALVTGVVLWAGFTASRLITHDAFERRPSALTTLNIAHELVTIVVMALIIGAFGSASA
ncbi:MAG TPA: DUF1761 domain-containing protein [Acidimicrobiia bacterium]|nr:DUF1761 domain-containing protein [Acidimicrobiia bacterium]